MRMRKLLISLSVLFFFPVVYGYGSNPVQEDCSEQASVYADSVALIIEQGRWNRLPELLFQWEQSCETTEPLFRIRMLQLISEGQFPGQWEGSQMLEFAIAFDIRDEISHLESPATRQEYFELYEEYFGYVSVNSNFDRQTQRWARQMRARFTAGQPEWAWLTLYSGETGRFFSLLRDDKYQGSQLTEVYKERVAYFQKRPELNMGVGSGVWIPTADLEVIGFKPTLDIFAGVKYRNTYFDLAFSMRFGQTQKPFKLSVRDSIVETRNYQGGFLGIETTHIFFRPENYAMGMFISGGADLIDVVEDRQDPIRRTFVAAAVQMGPVASYHFPNRSRVSAKLGYYMFLNHSNTVGSSLQGNAWSLRILFGFSDNARKTENLRRLGY